MFAANHTKFERVAIARDNEAMLGLLFMNFVSSPGSFASPLQCIMNVSKLSATPVSDEEPGNPS